ncbi:MAG: hypothetical protein ACK2U5_15830 [Candidatus Promineifilaceae bacterium]|jgi:hypothetical protein
MAIKLTHDCGAFYTIQLQGILDQNWVDQYGDFNVLTIHSEDAHQPPVTIVVGTVVDQAALMGFLNLVYDLGMPLLSVAHLRRA